MYKLLAPTALATQEAKRYSGFFFHVNFFANDCSCMQGPIFPQSELTSAMTDEAQSATWTFLSNHGHVLVCLAVDPNTRLRDIAAQVGITERAIQKILGDLEGAGIITRIREGRRNRYVVHPDAPLRHPLEAHQSVGDLLSMVVADWDRRKRPAADD